MVRIVKEWDTLSAREKVERAFSKIGEVAGLKYRPTYWDPGSVFFGIAYADSNPASGYPRCVGSFEKNELMPTVKLIGESGRAALEVFLAEAEKVAGVEITLVVGE